MAYEALKVWLNDYYGHWNTAAVMYLHAAIQNLSDQMAGILLPEASLTIDIDPVIPAGVIDDLVDWIMPPVDKPLDFITELYLPDFPEVRPSDIEPFVLLDAYFYSFRKLLGRSRYDRWFKPPDE